MVGPFVAPFGATEIGTGIPLSGMSLAHPMGVDQIGRDVFSRVLNGASSPALAPALTPAMAPSLAGATSMSDAASGDVSPPTGG